MQINMRIKLLHLQEQLKSHIIILKTSYPTFDKTAYPGYQPVHQPGSPAPQPVSPAPQPAQSDGSNKSDYVISIAIFIIGFIFPIIWFGGFCFIRSKNSVARLFGGLSIALLTVLIIVGIILIANIHRDSSNCFYQTSSCSSCLSSSECTWCVTSQSCYPSSNSDYSCRISTNTCHHYCFDQYDCTSCINLSNCNWCNSTQSCISTEDYCSAPIYNKLCY